MSDLLPCPWCQTTSLHLDSFRVACDDAGNLMAATDWRVMHDEEQSSFCEAWGPEMPTREAAITAWNRRAPSPFVDQRRCAAMSKESLRVLAGAYRPAEQIAADMVKPPPSVDWAVEGPRLLEALKEWTAITDRFDDLELLRRLDPAAYRRVKKSRAAIASATPGGETGT